MEIWDHFLICANNAGVYEYKNENIDYCSDEHIKKTFGFLALNSITTIVLV